MARPHPWTPRQRLRRDLLLLVASFGGLIALGLAVALPGIYGMHAARAYVAGEGLYSKAQKRAVFHLSRYAITGDPREWNAYHEAIAIPHADARAREALERDPPERAAAASAFVEAGNHPDDVRGLITLFAWARWIPEMRQAIAAWEEGDRHVVRLDATAVALHDARRGDPPDAGRVLALLAEVDTIDAELTRHEDRFS
ncbi:MAG TPA: hypothetical protein VMS55_01570, partial [Myxococcota bacterium]|nr:hypothetical protein [Myxococcota bacterium]